MRLVNRADIIIYTSPSIESFMSALEKSIKNKQVVNVSQIKSLTKLPNRALHHHEHHHHEDEMDGHIWLSVNNAMRISQDLTKMLITADPDHKIQYTENLQRLLERLEQLKQDIQTKMKAIRNSAFMQYHDAFQYFEHENGLQKSIFATANAEHQIGIKQIRHLKQQIKEQNVTCIFYEPPHIPKIINILSEDNEVKIAPIDPVGSQFNKGEDQYFELLTHVSDQLYNCLNVQH